MDKERVILVVDRNARNQKLIAELLGRHGYRVVSGETLDALDRALEDERVSVVLLDIAGFDPRMWERCACMKARQIPFVVLSRRVDVTLREACLAHGARAVFSKPVMVKELLEIVRGLAQPEL